MTKITYESQYGSVVITVPKEDMDIFEVADDLLKPMLYAVGYADKSIRDVFYDEQEFYTKEEYVPDDVREDQKTQDQMEFDFEDGALDKEEQEMRDEKVLPKTKKKGGKKHVK
jgi:hypothetical protein